MKELNIRNKRARFEFHLDEVFEAGIVLTGTEIKSIRNGKASILESYGLFEKGEVWLRNMHITAYENGSFYNHKPKADRKLLLQRKEILRIEKFLKIKGHTLVPLKLFLSEKGWVKIQIACATGKKLHDKRDSIKSRDIERDMKRDLK